MSSGVSIIIPTLNEELYLPHLLASLQEVEIPLDIIVADGASTDQTCEIARSCSSLFPAGSSLTVLSLKDRGIALQKNAGAAQARYERLVFCDADTVFPSVESFENLISICDERQYAIAGPILRCLEPGIFRGLLYRSLSLFQRFILRLGKAYIPGVCQVTTKTLFAQVGGFDTRVAIAEDIDFSMRIARLGSCGVVRTIILVSDRRHLTYGYLWVFKAIPNLFRLLRTGTVNPDTLYYPFGGYSGEPEHYATKRTSI